MYAYSCTAFFIYMHIYTCTAFNEKDAVNFKKSQDLYMRGFRGRKGKWEIILL